jgi:iron complex outermembrane receptor protein
MVRIRNISAVSALFVVLYTGAAVAQDVSPASQSTDETQVAEVVVTAARLRRENVQQTPIAVSVIVPEQIDSLHAQNIAALTSMAPNLYVSSSGSTPNNPVITIRGFNTAASDISTEPGIAVYIDGVYQSIIPGSLADLYDLDSVEVLRGPQGTLLGKNASAGAILLTRSQPTGELDGKVQIDYGTFNQTQASALLNFPIINGTLAGKLYANYLHRDDFITNLAVPGGDLGGENHSTARIAFLFTPTDDFKIYLTGDHITDRDAQLGQRNISGPTTVQCRIYKICAPDAGLFDVTRAGFLDGTRADDTNITARAEWNLKSVKLTSITGYRNYNQLDNVDLDGSTLPILQVFGFATDLLQKSEELRLSSIDGGGFDLNGKLDWLVAFYNNHSKAYSPEGEVALGNATERAEQVIRDGTAVFTHLDYKLLDALTLSAGVRESWDSVNHAYAFPVPGTVPPPLDHGQSVNFTNTSSEGGLQYQIDDSKMVFFRFAEGYRGGGFVGLPANPASVKEFAPETSKDYELGLKTDWFAKKLVLNLTLFDTMYQNLQKTAAVPGPGGTFFQTTTNAAAATTRGVEIESVLRPIDGFAIRTNVGFLDAFYTKYVSYNTQTGQVLNLSDTLFTYTPKKTVNITPSYTTNVPRVLGFDTVKLQGSFNWISSLNVSNATITPLGNQPAYATTDVSVTFGGRSGYSLTLYGKNLFDKHYITYESSPSGLADSVADGLPRTGGITFECKF